MDLTKVFNAVEKDFGRDISVMVIVFSTVNLAKTDITMEHMTKRGVYTEEIITEATGLLWGYTQDQITIAKDVWLCLHEWEIGQSLGSPDGACLGGCISRSFREIYDLQIERKLDDKEKED
jgi:hypothetical protein